MLPIATADFHLKVPCSMPLMLLEEKQAKNVLVGGIDECTLILCCFTVIWITGKNH